MSRALTIRELIEQVDSGQVRIPAFQRGFVWEPDRVAHFLDTLYKGYPFGALLFWRTKETLNAERKLGPFELTPHKDEFPIDYVLDGQQRLTSIYSTFQTERKIGINDFWKDIYFNHTNINETEDVHFFALSPSEVDKTKHFPLRHLFDTVAYRRATKHLNDQVAEKIDQIQTRFKEVRIPLQMFNTDDKGTVAVIFERINRQGVPLGTLQLLSAWTWSENFQLQGQFEELIDEVESKGFEVESTFDENLLLRCASAVLVANPRPESIVSIAGEDIRDRFDEVINGILGALDFLYINIGVRRLDNLPYQAILVPLAAFFAVSGNKGIVVDDEQRRQIIRWFWRTCFSKRYSNATNRNLEDDIKLMLQLKSGQKSNLGSFFTEIPKNFFLENTFGIRNVNTKTFILLLSSNYPLSFISRQRIDLDRKLKSYNKAEFHHLMPRAYAKDKSDKFSVNCLSNYSFLSSSENKSLGGVKPSQYRKKMPGDCKKILKSALCPETLFDDDFEYFVEDRQILLEEYAATLIA